MEPQEYEIMYRVEDSHWWYRGMATVIRRVIEKYGWKGESPRILEAGCGTGSGMVMLSGYGHVIGLDLSPHAIRLCRRRGQKNLLRASVMGLPFADASFHLVTSFDILYFAGVDDELAIQEAARVLIPGGKMVVRVPAFDWLRGIHDLKVSTGHRYTRGELRRKMEQSGLEVVFINYVNTILFPLILVKRLCERTLPTQKDSDLTLDLGFVGSLLRSCLVLESRVVTRSRFPFGLSIVAVGKKPSPYDESGNPYEKT